MARKVIGQGVDAFTAASRRAYDKMPAKRQAEIDAVAATALARLKARGVKHLGKQMVRDLMAQVGAYLVEEGIT